MAILTTSSITLVPVVKPINSGATQRARPVDTPPPQVTAAAPEAVVAPAQTQAAAAAASELEQVQQALNRLKASIKPALANSLEFQIDESTGKPIVKILDKETNALVRQIPSEEVLTIARALDRMQGRGGMVRERA